MPPTEPVATATPIPAASSRRRQEAEMPVSTLILASAECRAPALPRPARCGGTRDPARRPPAAAPSATSLGASATSRARSASRKSTLGPGSDCPTMETRSASATRDPSDPSP